jgi:hypothetical protein
VVSFSALSWEGYLKVLLLLPRAIPREKNQQQTWRALLEAEVQVAKIKILLLLLVCRLRVLALFTDTGSR